MFVGNSCDRSSTCTCLLEIVVTEAPPSFERKIYTLTSEGADSISRIRLVTCMHARIRSNSIGAPMRLCNSYILNRFAIGGPMQLVRGTDANWNSIRIDWVWHAPALYFHCKIFFFLHEVVFSGTVHHLLWYEENCQAISFTFILI